MGSTCQNKSLEIEINQAAKGCNAPSVSRSLLGLPVLPLGEEILIVLYNCFSVLQVQRSNSVFFLPTEKCN